MKSHQNEDTDDENCDDPIRLFDNSDINAVYFGSKLHGHGTANTESHWTLELIRNDEFCQQPQNFTLQEPDDDDLIQKLQGGTTSECDISLLSVKLVDCGKFPWYFRKYTQQIMQKINSNEHSDSDHEIDVENIVDDSDDCFIVENLEDVTKEISKNDQNCIETMKPIEAPPKVKKCIDINKRRLRDDKEMQIALSKKNMYQVDFKRNQGLVGMKITRKTGLNRTPNMLIDRNQIISVNQMIEKENAKQNCVDVDEKFLSAADKTLSSFGTQLIPITNEKENNATQCKINIEKDIGGKPALVKSSSLQNVTVQFEISKISEKLINHLKTKKTYYKSSEDKIVSKVPSESLKNNPENKLNLTHETKKSPNLTFTEKNTDSLPKVKSDVKNVKITNKYKNDQIKTKNYANHRSLIGLLVTNKNKDDNTKEIKCMKQKKRTSTQSITTKLDKKPRKKIKKQKYEPKSPILHCSTVPKKPKQEIHIKSDKDTISNLSKEPTEVKKIGGNISNLNSCNIMNEVNQLKNVIPKISSVTKPLDFSDKEVLQSQPCIMPDKTKSEVSYIHAKSLLVSEKVPKISNEVNKTYFNAPAMPSSQNKTSEQTVLHEIRQDNVIEYTINTVPDTNLSFKAPTKNYKPMVSNSNVSMTTTVAPTSESKPTLSNQYANFPIYHGSQVPAHNILPRKMNRTISNNNIEVPIQNRYASAIILKSNNNLMKLPFEKIHEPPPLQTMGSPPYRPMDIPSHTQQQFRDPPPPPYSIFYPPNPSGNNPEAYQSYFSWPANSVPNQFHPPQGRITQQLNNSMQNLYRDCWVPHNLVPPPPPPPPVPPTSIPPKNILDMNKSKDYPNLNPSSASIMQTPKSINQNSISTPHIKSNSSIIGINNDGLVKKINIVAMPIKTKFHTKRGTVNVEQITNPQIMNRHEDTKIITTKMEMSKELDKLSFIDENTKNSNLDFKEISPAKINSQNNKEKLAITTKNLSFNKKVNPMQSQPAKGYSPPILPIPTYQKVLDRVASNPQIQNTIPKIALQTENHRSLVRIETKPMRKRDFVKGCKRKLNNAWNNDEETRKREEAKKISLDEYKKRILKNNCKPEQNNKIGKEKYNNSGKRPNIDFKIRKNVDYNTETDLGYDSDSTVVL